MFTCVLLILVALFAAGLFVGAKCKWQTIAVTIIGVFILVLLMFLFEGGGKLTIEEVRRYGWSAIGDRVREFSSALAVFVSPLILGIVMGRSVRRRLKMDQNR